jgi:CHAT domain-containing protein/Tfp pilus assembly protein PilF
MRQNTISFVLAVLLSLAGVQPALTSEPEMVPELDAAITLYRKEGPRAALPVFERLAESFSESGKSRDQSIAIGFIGECHWRLGNFDESRLNLDRAIEMKKALGERGLAADSLNVLGLLEWDLGNYDQAIADFRRAGAIGAELGDRVLEGMTLNNLSLVYDELGDYQTSLAQYRKVLDIYRDVDHPRGEGETLGNIGGVYLLLGHYREALEYYQRSLAISESLQSRPSMSQDHGNIALCYLGFGEVETALEHFERAIELAREAGMRQDEAYWMGGKGQALILKGRYDLGLEDYRAALAIYEDIGARAEWLEAMHDLGQLHLLLGDPASAERHFRRAIDLAREIGLSRGVTLNLVALGDLYFHHQQLNEAAKLYGKARYRAEETGEQALLATSLLRLALIHREQAQLPQAKSEANQALETSREIGAQLIEAEAHYALAELARLDGRPSRALELFTAAHAAVADAGDPELLWQIEFGRALALETMGDKAAAIDALTSAVTIIEGVRDRLREERFRAGYVQDKYQVYVELVRLQLELGRKEDAFSTAERLRARSYAALVGRGATPALSTDEQHIENELRERIRQLQRFLIEEQRRTQPEQRQMAIRNFSRELLQAEQDYLVFLDDHALARPADRMVNPISSSELIRNRLRTGEALIEYVVGGNSVIVFVLTAHGMSVTSSPVRKSDLRSQIKLLRDLIRHPGDPRWSKPAASLAATLLAPVEQAGYLTEIRHIYLVPHGVLNYVPFALLPTSADQRDGLLLEDFTLTYLPAAVALLEAKSPAIAPQTLLAMAPASGRLRHAPEEASSIDNLFKPHSRLLVGSEATESSFKDLASNYQILHLATHGYFNKQNPLLSGLELEADEVDDGLLEVHEVLGLNLVADLVTLSACETALGSGYFAEVPAGDEFIGLTRAFLSAGSESVMATLWEVDDRSSVQFMQQFYRYANQAGEDAGLASALSHAQRTLRSSETYNHPYFWAPFVLVGSQGRNTDPIKLTQEG